MVATSAALPMNNQILRRPGRTEHVNALLKSSENSPARGPKVSNDTSMESCQPVILQPEKSALSQGHCPNLMLRRILGPVCVWKDNGGAVITTGYTRCTATSLSCSVSSSTSSLVGWPWCTHGNGRPSPGKVFLGRPQECWEK